VCHNYNNGAAPGGRCQEGDDCKRLHICEKYLIHGSCDCSRAHDFYEPHPLKVLQERRVPNEIMPIIKDLYANIQVLKKIYRKKPFTDKPGIKESKPRSELNEPAPERGLNNPQSDLPMIVLSEKTEICMFFIKGHCKNGDSCWKEHCAMPYQWEVKEGDEWKALTENEAIERDYCDPANINSCGLAPVCFDSMTRGSASVRRLSTVSSVLQPSFILTTEWLWFWMDEGGRWVQYASPEGGHQLSSISSSDLEEKYQADPHAELEFTAGSQTYLLSFQGTVSCHSHAHIFLGLIEKEKTALCFSPEMIQANKLYKTKKSIRRRPKFISAADVITIKSRVALSPSEGEYNHVQELFELTMSRYTISSIHRIQNKELWEVFQWKKDCMRRSRTGGNVPERQLFHGTDSKHVEVICRENFDWRICGVNGTAYGKGSYFARDAKYSHSYTNNSPTRCMFLCRVLVGDFTRGDASFVRAPPKDGGNALFYDSCVDDTRAPSIFVVFEKHQIYPEYLIQYTDASTSTASTSSVAYNTTYYRYPTTVATSSAPKISSNSVSAPYRGSYSGAYSQSSNTNAATTQIRNLPAASSQSSSITAASSQRSYSPSKATAALSPYHTSRSSVRSTSSSKPKSDNACIIC
ncbi:hypothetical protein DNTS_018771, partial [Danionella cerebrum]